MKWAIKILFSIFFASAIGVHVFAIFQKDTQPFWWHFIYFVTYGSCWAMFFLKHKNRLFMYSIMGVFPFITHLYYGYQHIATLDSLFWVCVLTCTLLFAGIFGIKYTNENLF